MVLVDSEGFAVYSFAKDRGTTSSCYSPGEANGNGLVASAGGAGGSSSSSESGGGSSGGYGY